METARPRQLRMLESIEDAIKEDISGLGGPKEAAKHFFPDKSPDQGAAILRAWCLENRPERPNPSQLFLLIELARKGDAGASDCARFIEQRLCCRIEWLSPEDERMRHERELIETVNKLERLQDRIERLRAQSAAPEPKPTLRSVRQS